MFEERRESVEHSLRLTNLAREALTYMLDVNRTETDAMNMKPIAEMFLKKALEKLEEIEDINPE